MLIACPDCRRQYDVQGMAVGDHVRCRCGHLCEVPKRRPQEARVLHCSGCGGKLQARAASCSYCGADVAASDRNLGPACPECFSRMAAGAAYCSTCGVKIQAEAIQGTRASASCPRCKGDLVHREADTVQYTECARCGGIWLDAHAFDRMVTRRDTEAFAPVVRGAPAAAATAAAGDGGSGPEAVNAIAYVPCPVCGSLMHRKNFAGCSGVIIDWCKGHGFWFDAFELEKVLEFIREGGLDKSRLQEIERARRQLESLQDERRAVSRAGAAWSVERRVGTQESLASWIVSLGDLAGSIFRHFR
jgi:Zn-finger nucleic acid-binding protein